MGRVHLEPRGRHIHEVESQQGEIVEMDYVRTDLADKSLVMSPDRWRRPEDPGSERLKSPRGRRDGMSDHPAIALFVGRGLASFQGERRGRILDVDLMPLRGQSLG